MSQDTSKPIWSHLGNSSRPSAVQTQSSVRADMQAIDQFALFGLLDAVGRWMEPSVARWTASDLIEKLGVVRRHHWIVERWLDELGLHGLIDGDRAGWSCTYRPSRKQLRMIRTDMKHAAARLGYGPVFVHTLLELLRRSAELLRDEITIQTLFFPDGSIKFAKDIYETSAISRYLNTAAADAIAAFDDRSIRVLELGAGIGGTTSAIAASDVAIGHYAYTDVSSWFLELGQQRFGEHLPLSVHRLAWTKTSQSNLPGQMHPADLM